MNIFFGWHLSYEKISCLARLGSGSACRSLFSGICRWNKGEKETGEDSYAEPLQQYVIDTLMFGVVIVSSEEKEISSRVGMATTAETSLLFQMWPNVVEEHMKELLKLLDETPRNLHKFGAIVEHNAMTMHATAISASPSVLYWKEKSIATILKVYQLRKSDPSLFLYITMDAGPNLKLLFLQKDIAFVQSHFSGIKIVEPLWN